MTVPSFDVAHDREESADEANLPEYRHAFSWNTRNAPGSGAR